MADYTQTRIHPWPNEVGADWSTVMSLHGVGTLRENELTCNSSGHTRPQWSYLAEPVDWSWPKKWNRCERADLHLGEKKKKKSEGGGMNDLPSKSSQARKKPSRVSIANTIVCCKPRVFVQTACVWNYLCLLQTKGVCPNSMSETTWACCKLRVFVANYEYLLQRMGVHSKLGVSVATTGVYRQLRESVVHSTSVANYRCLLLTTGCCKQRVSIANYGYVLQTEGVCRELQLSITNYGCLSQITNICRKLQ